MINAKLGRAAEVLLVEDNDNDVELTKIGFRRSRFAVNLNHVEDGEECMALLRKEGKYLDAPTPDLILLDMNMPRMDGREVMQAMAQDVRLQCIPVVVLTSSQTDIDVLAAYKLRCNSYIAKPIDFANFAAVIQSLSDYWFTLVILPPKPIK